MQLLERFRLKEKKDLVPTPSVRLLVMQPIPYWEMDDVFQDENILTENIEFTRSVWLIKGQDAQNPGQVVSVGGRITKEDKEKAAESFPIVSIKSNGSVSKDDVEHQMTAWRSGFEEVHLQGKAFSDITPIPDSTKEYTFSHSREGLAARRETWMTVEAPLDFHPLVVHQEEDKISEAVVLTPTQVRQMFDVNELAHDGTFYPLVDNLSSDEQARVRHRVSANQQDVLRVRRQVLDHLSRKEKEYRLKLVYQMIYHSENHPQFGPGKHEQNHDSWWQRFSGSMENPAGFSSTYRDFLKAYRKVLPNTDDRQSMLRKQMQEAWKRVQWEEYSAYTAAYPVQGDFLAAAWLPLEDSGDYEAKALEENGPENVRKLLGTIINQALSPHVTENEIERLGHKYAVLRSRDPESGSLSMTDRYKRLELYRYLMAHEQDAILSPDELLLFKAWDEHMYAVLQQETGMTRLDFAAVSELHNISAEEVERRIIPKIHPSAVVPTLMQRHQLSQVSQLGEHFLMSHGYSQDDDTQHRGEAIDPKAIVDSRVKLFAMLTEWEGMKSHREGVSKSTRVWRKSLSELCYPDTKDSTYTIYQRKKGIKDVITTGRANIDQNAGITARHRRTKLSHQGVPISFFEKSSDKRIQSLLRKMVERGWKPNKVLDRQRTLMILDTTSDDARLHLHRLFSEQRPFISEEISYDEWVRNWAVSAIRETLIPSLREHIEKKGFIFNEVQVKDVLDSGKATAGSAGSIGGYGERKSYVELDFTHALAGGYEKRSNEAERIELAIFPTEQDAWTKLKDDEDYERRRFSAVAFGSDLRSFQNVAYPSNVYPVYADIAARSSGREKKMLPQRRIKILAEQVFGPVKSVIYQFRSK